MLGEREPLLSLCSMSLLRLFNAADPAVIKHTGKSVLGSGFWQRNQRRQPAALPPPKVAKRPVESAAQSGHPGPSS